MNTTLAGLLMLGGAAIGTALGADDFEKSSYDFEAHVTDRGKRIKVVAKGWSNGQYLVVPFDWYEHDGFKSGAFFVDKVER